MGITTADKDFAERALARQGAVLPPDRVDGVAAAAVRTATAARELESRLSLSDDVYGFLTLLSRARVP